MRRNEALTRYQPQFGHQNFAKKVISQSADDGMVVAVVAIRDFLKPW